MSYPINYPTPQGANVQIFRGGNTSTTANSKPRDWVKPQGASFVWFTLIGAGGGGGGCGYDDANIILYYGGGGASGNVTNFMCPAFLLPDVLQVAIGRGGNGGSQATQATAADGTNGESTQIFYQQKTGTGYQLLIASGGAGGQGGNASPGSEYQGAGGAGQAADIGGPMTAAGFYNATGGQTGATRSTNAGNITADGLTFVMGGNAKVDLGATTTGYYGYTASQIAGYSQISPIIMSISGVQNQQSTTTQRSSPFGCGGNGGGDNNNIVPTYGCRGGDGLAIIVTW